MIHCNSKIQFPFESEILMYVCCLIDNMFALCSLGNGDVRAGATIW